VLSELGTAQARAAAQRVTGRTPEITAVLSSPLRRCTGTAAEFQLPVTVDDDLIECDFGQWEGLTFAEVRARWPMELERWLGSTAVAPPGGESFRRVATRVRRFLARVRDSYPGGTLVVVSHVTPIKLLLRDALLAGDELLHRLYLDPAGISTLDLYPDGGVAVRTVNEVAEVGTVTPAKKAAPRKRAPRKVAPQKAEPHMAEPHMAEPTSAERHMPEPGNATPHATEPHMAEPGNATPQATEPHMAEPGEAVSRKKAAPRKASPRKKAAPPENGSDTAEA
jgi:broad specificity phosphatase PhoE